METSPLGRAEWIKLFGELFGEQEKADSIYNNVLTEYNQLKQLAAQLQHKTKVLSENIINGTWYVPGGDSYMAQLFADAGSTYAWSDVHTTGSIPLDMAQVLEKSHDADVWLIKSLESSFSYTKLKAQNALNSEFKAFKQKNIYFCDTERTTLYQDFPFHPELLLKEYIAIFNPQLLPDYNTQYYKPLLDE
jgi:iron complex transport system substrate-binding protein